MYGWICDTRVEYELSSTRLVIPVHWEKVRNALYILAICYCPVFSANIILKKIWLLLLDTVENFCIFQQHFLEMFKIENLYSFLLHFSVFFTLFLIPIISVFWVENKLKIKISPFSRIILNICCEMPVTIECIYNLM